MLLLVGQTVRQDGLFRRAKKYFWIGVCPLGAGVGLAEAVSCESPVFMCLVGQSIGKPIMRPINSSFAREACEP